jgi:hypothetical protein
VERLLSGYDQEEARLDSIDHDEAGGMALAEEAATAEAATAARARARAARVRRIGCSSCGDMGQGVQDGPTVADRRWSVE